MTGLIWAITWTAYAIGAVLFTRNRIRFWGRPGVNVDPLDGFERGAATLAALLCGLIWPLSTEFLLLRGWLFRPVDQDWARRARLKTDRDDWRTRQRQAPTDEERRMAQDIADTLDELLREGK